MTDARFSMTVERTSTIEMVKNRVCWSVAILFVFAYIEANTGCSFDGGPFAICHSGFPGRMLVLSDAGGLQPFAWGVRGVNTAIGVFAFLSLGWLCWGRARLPWVQYSFGALFAAAFAWANPILTRLRASDQQTIPGFTQPSFIDAGFPFTFLSSAKGLQLVFAVLNIAIGLVCLEAIFRLFQRDRHDRQPNPNALNRWAAVWAPLCGYVWITEHYGRVSTLWQRFGLAYFVTDAGLAQLHWWVAATDVLTGALLVVLLFVIATSQRANIIIFLAGYVWANLDGWPRWYGWLRAGGDFQIGFPFPFYQRWSGSTDLLVALVANVLIGLTAAYFIYRRSQSQNQATTSQLNT